MVSVFISIFLGVSLLLSAFLPPQKNEGIHFACEIVIDKIGIQFRAAATNNDLRNMKIAAEEIRTDSRSFKYAAPQRIVLYKIIISLNNGQTADATNFCKNRKQPAIDFTIQDFPLENQIKNLLMLVNIVLMSLFFIVVLPKIMKKLLPIVKRGLAMTAHSPKEIQRISQEKSDARTKQRINALKIKYKDKNQD
jgi:hypothetical protein